MYNLSPKTLVKLCDKLASSISFYYAILDRATIFKYDKPKTNKPEFSVRNFYYKGKPIFTVDDFNNIGIDLDKLVQYLEEKCDLLELGSPYYRASKMISGFWGLPRDANSQNDIKYFGVGDRIPDDVYLIGAITNRYKERTIIDLVVDAIRNHYIRLEPFLPWDSMPLYRHISNYFELDEIIRISSDMFLLREDIRSQYKQYMADIDKLNREAIRQSSNNRTKANSSSKGLKSSEIISVNAPINQCHAVIMDDGIYIARKGTSINIPLDKRLVLILKRALEDAIKRATKAVGESEGSVGKAAIHEMLSTHGVILQFTHDSLRRALNDSDRKKEQNRKDMSQLRRSVSFSCGSGLIGNFDKERGLWESTVRFKLKKASTLDLPYSPDTLPYFESDKRDSTRE
ncbi:MAG: hypothetical protein ACYSWP_15080 [Planctomycetota bacterium]|jgi:hypothetical protein